MNSLPNSIQRSVSGYQAEDISVGHSTATVTRYSKLSDTLFLKQSPISSDPDPGHSVIQEGKIISWLSNKLPVPELLDISSDDKYEYLLMRGIPGKDCSSVSTYAEAKENTHSLVEALNLLQAIDISECPFDQTLKIKLPIAQTRVEMNLVDPFDFDTDRLGKSANTALQELLTTPCPAEELVFCHGDLCLPNVMIMAGRCSGFIDLGRAGIADKYQDLALLGKSISSNLNPLYSRSDFEFILDSIGESNMDTVKMQYYCLLDEFF